MKIKMHMVIIGVMMLITSNNILAQDISWSAQMAESVMTRHPPTKPTLLTSVENKFPVPDSVITDSSFSEINLDNRLIAFPLWPDEYSDSTIIHKQDEKIYNRENQWNQFGLNRAVENVQKGSVMVFPVKCDTPAPSIIIFPGGAFLRITIDKEGVDIAQRFNKYGITTIVVKYRTVPSYKLSEWDYRSSGPMYDAFFSDAKQAIHVIRSRASEFGIDPNKIGVMGFSAGGRLAANLLVEKADINNDLETHDSLSTRPDFGCLIYPVITDLLIARITAKAPPTFIIHCRDDNAAPATYAENFYNALIEKKIISEAHFYETGGHGFGLGVNGGDVARWPALFVNWMKELNMIDQR